jgi:hypothetical protein
MIRTEREEAHACNTGNSTTYGYSRMREALLIHLCTDWMGDDAWLWKLDSVARTGESGTGVKPRAGSSQPCRCL